MSCYRAPSAQLEGGALLGVSGGPRLVFPCRTITDHVRRAWISRKDMGALQRVRFGTSS